jgi:DNA-binding CsgD family transcriptional regulator
MNMKQTLTIRQREIMKLIKKKSRPEVAEILGLSRKTIDSHLGTIFKILNVKTLTEALTELGS